ncbi:Pol polyprotein [Plakobranchus ocellatus]|uniref:Pol polyprotein n=1 Tax=Plakobranchus ocellatus TaxID=259542 RepID=A0AAV4BIY2_9GAST|nr:Pol polyprotein [Plakobranchus ocellatus]
MVDTLKRVTDLLKKDRVFSWGPAQQKAFDVAKENNAMQEPEHSMIPSKRLLEEHHCSRRSQQIACCSYFSRRRDGNVDAESYVKAYVDSVPSSFLVTDQSFTQQVSCLAFPQANGHAESAVKIAKKILSQPEPDIALFNYRATAHSSTETSPARKLMGRELKSNVPFVPDILQPNPLKDAANLRATDEITKRANKLNCDRKHGAVSLPVLKTGDPVLIKLDNDRKCEAQGSIVATDRENRTYLVNSPVGAL